MTQRALALRRLAAVCTVVFVGLAPSSINSADLMDLYLRAIEFDPTFQRARFERSVALQTLKESRGGLAPQISLNADVTDVQQNIRESDNFLFPEGKSRFYNSNYSISLTQALYRKDVYARVPQARAEVRQADATFLAAEQDLIFRLSQALFTYLAAQDSLGFATAERQAIAAQLHEGEERLGAGLVTIADVQDLRGRFALAQAAEIEARGVLEDSRHAIAEITSEVPDEIKTLADRFPLTRPEQDDVKAWVDAALFQNPRIRALQAAAEVARHEMHRQRAAYVPAFDLLASFRHTDSGGTVFGEGNEIQNTEVGVRLTVPIFDGGRTSARVTGAALQRSIAQADLERERRRIEREVRVSFSNVIASISRVEALEKSVFAHQAALSVKEEGWRSGINTGLIVLDARKELFSAMRDLAQARYLHILNSLKLKQGAGILGVEDLQQVNAYLQ